MIKFHNQNKLSDVSANHIPRHNSDVSEFQISYNRAYYQICGLAINYSYGHQNKSVSPTDKLPHRLIIASLADQILNTKAMSLSLRYRSWEQNIPPANRIFKVA